MKIIKKSKEINSFFNSREAFGFVPTMGFLHDGHASLIKKSVSQNKKTIVSIFVNPKQFNKKKDLIKYPRNTKRDMSICKKLGVDYVFMPTFNEIYKWKKTNKKIPKIKNILEDKFRKNHFKGVLAVIDKLFDIVKAKKVYLGKKDYQQIQVIKDYIKINNLKIKIIECNTIRAKNGIALSSRNFRLKETALNKTAQLIREIKKFKKYNHNKKFIKRDVIKIFNDQKIKYDYVENINLKKFTFSKFIKRGSNFFIAFYVDNIRLIDNF